jgi:anti-sigma factor RsiW
MVITDACPPEQRIAAFVDGALSAAERAELQHHVDRCAACFDLLATLSAQVQQPVPTVEQTLREAALGRHRQLARAYRTVPALAAAAALVVAVVWWRQPAGDRMVPLTTVATQAPADSGTRSFGSGGVHVEQPVDGDLINGKPEVRWSAPTDAVAFEIIVTSSAGDVLWQRRVPGTSRSARVEVDLPSGKPYYLWVAAFLPENRRLASNVVKVHTAEP